MGVYIEDNKLVIIIEPKTSHFDLPEDVRNNMKHGINSIMKHDELLAEHTIKNKISQLLLKYKH